MKKIDYEKVPFNYMHCSHATCAARDSCLRALAWQSLPSSVLSVSVVNPAAITPNETCAFYRNSTLRPFANGFIGMQNNMYPKQYDAFSNRLIFHFGRSSFYERRSGARDLNPHDQTVIRQVLREVGADENLRFDKVTYQYLW